MTTKTILMTAFEPSGDCTWGDGCSEGCESNSILQIRIVGLGGSEMEAAGVELLAHTTDEAAMGFECNYLK